MKLSNKLTLNLILEQILIMLIEAIFFIVFNKQIYTGGVIEYVKLIIIGGIFGLILSLNHIRMINKIKDIKLIEEEEELFFKEFDSKLNEIINKKENDNSNDDNCTYFNYKGE